MAFIESSLPPNMIIPDATATVKGILKLTNDLGGTADLPTVPDLVNKTEWKGIWTQQQYILNDQVLDEGYLAIANTTTEERPAPQRVGEKFNVYNGTIGTTTSNARQILFGNKYTFTENVFFEGWRINLIAGNSYVVYLVRDPDGESIISQILQFVAQTNGWINLNAQNLIIQEGSTYAAVAVVSEPAAIPLEFNGNWSYAQPQNPTIPINGQITQPRSVPSLLYVNNIDSGSSDRSSELITLNVGDLIKSGTNTWAIQSISPQSGYFIFGVSPALLNLNTGVQNFIFETKSTTTLTYPFETDYWLSNPSPVATVNGLLGIDVPYTTIVPDNTAYGVDLLVQKLVVSDDWDIQAFSGIGGSSVSSGGGSGVVNINGNEGSEFRVAQGDTGVLEFAGLTYNSATTINIGATKGYVVDNETDPLQPSYIFVDYPGQTGVTVTTLGSGIGSTVSLQPDGFGSAIPVFQNSIPDSAMRKTHLWLGKVGHPTNVITTPTAVINEPDYITSPQAFSRDLFQVLGPYINDGVIAYANGANLQINITAGNIHGNGINFNNDRTRPNEIATGPFTPLNFLYRTRVGTGGGLVNLITPNSYDVAGVITPVGGGVNNSTLQYIFCIPGSGFIIQYGQTIYNNLTEAIANVGRESFVIYPNLPNNAILIGVLALIRTATALNNTSQARFFPANKLGEIVGATSGISTGTRQTSYNNSLQPQTIVSDTLGADTWRSGRALNTSDVMRWQNIAGTTTGNITGNGDLTVNNIIANLRTNVQAGTTYTILTTDKSTQIITTNSSPVTITIPSGLGAGFNCEVLQQGTGQVSFVASGVTLRYSTFELPSIIERYGLVGIDSIPNVVNEIHLFGQLSSI